MKCPDCNGDLVASSEDHDNIDADSCEHAFDCEPCEKTFVIEFHPIDIREA